MSANTIGKSLEVISRRFSALSDTPLLDAQVLVAHVINQPRTWVLAHPENELSSADTEALSIALAKIENGTPLPYILGSWEFFGRKFFITPDVLIPRPETELLVEKALVWLGERLNSTSNKKLLSVDIGCGSGCIGISLAIYHPNLHVTASDISFAALSVASQNAIIHRVMSQLHFVQCDLIPPTYQKFDLICANLPYIPTSLLSQLKVFKKEPTHALDGGIDGLEIIKRLLSAAPQHLASEGLMLLEIDSTQGDSAKKIAHTAFPNAAIELFQDLSGHDRLISIQQGK